MGFFQGDEVALLLARLGVRKVSGWPLALMLLGAVGAGVGLERLRQWNITRCVGEDPPEEWAWVRIRNLDDIPGESETWQWTRVR